MKPLTPREKQIAALVARGMPNKVIAAKLGVSTRTVEAHIQHAAQRIGREDISPRHSLTVWFYDLSA